MHTEDSLPGVTRVTVTVTPGTESLSPAAPPIEQATRPQNIAAPAPAPPREIASSRRISRTSPEIENVRHSGNTEREKENTSTQPQRLKYTSSGPCRSSYTPVASHHPFINKVSNITAAAVHVFVQGVQPRTMARCRGPASGDWKTTEHLDWVCRLPSFPFACNWAGIFRWQMETKGLITSSE